MHEAGNLAASRRSSADVLRVNQDRSTGALALAQLGLDRAGGSFRKTTVRRPVLLPDQKDAAAPGGTANWERFCPAREWLALLEQT